jgi:outer membrane receptor for ferrienterochelin and colicin
MAQQLKIHTGNVTTVSAKEIENQPVNNPLLHYRSVPGLFITQNSKPAIG